MTLHGMSAAEATIRRVLLDGVSSRLIYEGNVCDKYPCWNDAQCVPINATTASYKCICPDEFAGIHCQYRISDYCTDNNCTNGTVCTVHDGIAACIADDLVGVYPSCSELICLNNGKCIQEAPKQYRCVCANGYRGTYCHLALDASLVAPWIDSGSILLLVSLSILVLLSIMMICMSTNAGCYLILPGETRYMRWDTATDDEYDEDISTISPEGSDSVPLQHISSISGLKNSQTTETVIDLNGGPSGK